MKSFKYQKAKPKNIKPKHLESNSPLRNNLFYSFFNWPALLLLRIKTSMLQGHCRYTMLPIILITKNPITQNSDLLSIWRICITSSLSCLNQVANSNGIFLVNKVMQKCCKVHDVISIASFSFVFPDWVSNCDIIFIYRYARFF